MMNRDASRSSALPSKSSPVDSEAEALPPHEESVAVTERFWAYLAAIISGSVTLLAFLIPSIQAQWDRYLAREVVEQYVSLGDDCVKEERYDVAEKAYDKAFELSLQTRLDVDRKRLIARVSRMSMLTEWATVPPEDLEDVDFQLLLHMQQGPQHAKQRAFTLHSYGSFLAGSGKLPEAEAAISEAIELDPKNSMLYLNLGNLQDQAGREDAAIKTYIQAIALDPSSVNTHYNLGLLYFELGRNLEAKQSLGEALRLSPDPETKTHYDAVLQKLESAGPSHTPGIDHHSE
jgi:tetratricopeptide (TPR) repeat protein